MTHRVRMSLVVTVFTLAFITNPTFAESDLENKICDEGKFFTVQKAYPNARPRQDMALVYLLRMGDRWGGILNIRVTTARFWIFADKKLIGVLGNQTYSAAHLNPGTHTFWVKIDRGKAPIQVLKMKVEANKTYYMFVDASRLASGHYGTRLWVHDKAEFVKQKKEFYCRSTIKADKVTERRDKFLQKHYEESTTVSNTYPKSLGSSPPNLKRINLAEIEKRLTRAKPYDIGYQIKKDIPAPSAGKAMLVILGHGPNFYYRSSTRYYVSARGYRLRAHMNNFIDDKLVSLSYYRGYINGAYSIVEVEPGERLLWSSWYTGGGFRAYKTLNAIRINFKAGQTYYIDQVFGVGHMKHSILMRVVNKELGESILHELAWRTVFTKRSRRLEKKLIKKYYEKAKKIATRYPDQHFAGGGFPPSASEE